MIRNFSTVKKVGLLLGLVLSFVSIFNANASHLRAGEITVERSTRFSRVLIITITVYTNTASTVVFGGDGILSFGDGSPDLVIPATPSTPRPDLGPNIGIASITVTHTYSSNNGAPVISYVEPNRNGDVKNMDNSFFTTFYLETKFDMSVSGGNFSPKLLIPPIDQACSGVAFFHNPGAYDSDVVDSLSYEMVVPFRDRQLPVINYRDPNNKAFYAGLPYSNEEGDGPPTFSINPVNGTLIWDAPGMEGEYNIAFHVNEWRKNEAGIWILIGYVRRDMQIIVNGDCTNERPLIEVPLDTCVVAGAILNKTITGTDPNNTPSDKVKIEAFSEVFNLRVSPATYSPVPGPDDFITPPAITDFSWNTVCAHIKGQPYQVTFKITDKPILGPKLVTEATWQITVVAPAPVLNTATVQIPQRFVELQWDPYECSATTDAEARIQVWRRVDATSYTPINCDTGMPEGLGFSMIALVPITSTSYVDTNNNRGLERGVKYCYRLVAIFPSRGAESYVSNEHCIDPMDIAAPLITKVTVDETSETTGKITVNWIPPLNPLADLDDYRYQVERAEGSGFTPVSAKTDDGTLTFTDDFLNTLNEQYSYRVMLYIDGNNNPVDSSSIASSVWLDLSTQNGQINLNWSANVPWSNQLQGVPHDIYRGPEGSSTISDLTLLTTVDVTEEGLRYVDGEPPAPALDTTQVYCYLVVARGGYGNSDPAVPNPLVNQSQINCAQPTDPIPPCTPVITVFEDPCDTFFNKYNCSSTQFESTVKWTVDCEDDIRGYYLYVASSANGTYSPIKNPDGTKKLIRETFETITDLPSLAYCYRIEAVDRSGNVSALSEPVCSSNCPNYELPNIFTPNGDLCNDTFSAYGVAIDLPEGFERCEAPKTNDPRCARFVQRVDFKVFNRWGRKIYEYVGQRGNENSIYINWDGRDDSGRDLPSGYYFYSADVTFDSTTPGGTVKTYKGWVNLAR